MSSLRTRLLGGVGMGASLIGILAAGCGGGGGAASPTPNPNEPQMVKDARANYPTFLDLQVGVISSTCSPNPGVCHNSNNYPNMLEAGDTIANVGSHCNVEIPDPTQGWDGCERPADELVLGGFISKVAFLNRLGEGTWSIGWKDPAPIGGQVGVTFRDANGAPKFNPGGLASVMVSTTAGMTSGSLTVGGDDFIRRYVDGILYTIIPGDPNRNGVWGAETTSGGGLVFAPGNLQKSYLWRRITGTVNGTRMPLANAPLTDPAYVAIACWIEGLPDPAVSQAQPSDPINYDSCQFARNPVSYAIP